MARRGRPRLKLDPTTPDLTGRKFTRWKVKHFIGYRKTDFGERTTLWLCVCSCETKTHRIVRGYDLTCGRSISCGCIQQENTRAKHLQQRDKLIDQVKTEIRSNDQKEQEAQARAGVTARMVECAVATNNFGAAHAAVTKAEHEYRESLALKHRTKMSLAESGLDVRSVNGLERAGVHTFEDLVRFGGDDLRANLMALPNFGERTIAKIELLLEAAGLYTPPDEEGER